MGACALACVRACACFEEGNHVLVQGGEVMASVNKDNMNRGQRVRG